MYHYQTFVWAPTAPGLQKLDDYLNDLAAEGWRIVGVNVAANLDKQYYPNTLIEVLAERMVGRKKLLVKDCLSCEADPPKEVDNYKCPKSRRECGHHCNHIWTHDKCCWCEKEV